MFLNRLAGRHLGDPLNSAVLPWITDFTSPSGTLRDLTKSKYHLSKGEAQLDANYKVPISGGKISDELLHSHMLPSISECGTNVTELVETVGSIINEPPTACLRDDDNIISGREDMDPPSQLDVEKPPSIDTWSPLSFQPHHLLDMMPNLAYYTYMARRTPKPTLVRFVRPVYRPHEFASSMSRLYESTPDECIPEFFTDPSVFTSIHPDMPDLSLPPWCSNPDEFIKYHSCLLESESVSSRLHHWIDLTFGYKLIGKAAMEAKNVHLELAGSQSVPRRSGVVCLFRTPHPHRIPESQLVTYFLDKCPFINGSCHSITDRADQTKSGTHDAETQNVFLLDDAVRMDYRTRVHLPADYDPLALISSYEGLCRFLASETSKPIQLDLSIGSSETSPVVSMKALFDRDVEAIACFAVELYTHSLVNYSEADQWNHEKRVKVARNNARLYWDRIPYCLHQGLRLVLQPFADETQNLLSTARFLPSTSQLLNILFEFPSYMFDLHMVIQWVSR
ncbi:hypothetical protein PHET_08878 [Paragonimus heterotremus]|uniref:BEACH domain-containing protein n=1 Tax=Paragonimus heterotremus TaxID=100268 RepID=A0A8J4T4I6_9TREM|nr:hypothetical protein PHET_08878 [Paragonimus heterotremus]